MPKATKYKQRTTSIKDPLKRDEAHTKAHETVLPVIQSLKSANEKDRKWSSAIISELVQDDTLRLTLLREGVVNALLDRLTDNNAEVKIDALGSIDALILKQGQSLCKELYRKNILKLLQVVADEYLEKGDEIFENKAKLKEHFAAEELLYTVANRICHECEEAAEAASKTMMFVQAMEFLTLDNFPLSFKLVLAQFGRIITTDRPEAITVLANANCRSVERISRSNGEDEEKLFEEDKILMPSLKLVLGDIVVNSAEAEIPNGAPPPKQLPQVIRYAKERFLAEIKSDATSVTDSPSDDLIASLRTLSSVASYLDGYLEIYSETIPSENKDTEMNEPDPFEEDEMDVDDNDTKLPPIDASLLTELLSAIPLILQQQLSIPVIPHALETINDITWVMTIRIPEWQQWKTIARQLLEFAVPRIEGMVALGEETATTFLGCIWAAAKSFPGTFSFDADDIQLLEKLYGQSTSTELRTEIVGILGLAAQTDSIETNRYITNFLMQGITSQIPSVVIEIVDALMEIFANGDKVYDKPVFVEGQLLPTLKQMLPKLRKLIKSIDTRKEGELRERAEDVLENFTEFLKYKEDEAKAN